MSVPLQRKCRVGCRVAGARGAADSNPDPTPPDSQKFSYPPFCNLRFLGKLLARQVLKNFFFGHQEGAKHLFTPCVYTQISVENSKMGEKYETWLKT